MRVTDPRTAVDGDDVDRHGVAPVRRSHEEIAAAGYVLEEVSRQLADHHGNATRPRLVEPQRLRLRRCNPSRLAWLLSLMRNLADSISVESLAPPHGDYRRSFAGLGFDLELVDQSPRASGPHTHRDADPNWPAVGSRFHHRVGTGPLTVKDHTEVLQVDPPHRLVLRARARPLGTAKVEMVLEPRDGGTHVTMIEVAGDPLSKLALNRLTDRLVHHRNVESLRRLRRIAEAGVLKS